MDPATASPKKHFKLFSSGILHSREGKIGTPLCYLLFNSVALAWTESQTPVTEGFVPAPGLTGLYVVIPSRVGENCRHVVDSL